MRIISCGSKKVDHPVEAQDLYQGSLFRLARAWAEQSPDGKWGILSAKWGLLRPWLIVEPYDYTFKKAPSEWIASVIATLPEAVEVIEVAAPMRYVDPLIKFDNRIIPVLRGVGGIGCQMQWLKRNTI